MKVELLVDGKKIDLNGFVEEILSGIIVGAVTSLRGVENKWKQIEIKVTKCARISAAKCFKCQWQHKLEIFPQLTD